MSDAAPATGAADLPPPFEGGGQGEVERLSQTSPDPSLVRRGTLSRLAIGASVAGRVSSPSTSKQSSRNSTLCSGEIRR
jgi:hypothetical protein